jgi:catechol 2,3-dioxygenase-like lactoylglutathione lyase family enzyme
VIDHVSVAVGDLAKATRFYETLLATIEIVKIESRPATVGFGKTYPEILDQFARRSSCGATGEWGTCLFPRTIDRACRRVPYRGTRRWRLKRREPGYRPSHGDGYYAAFIRDPDGNRIEAVTFVGAK